MIKFQNITKVYPPKTIALKSVSFQVEKGEFLVVCGKSGAGKTTLFRLLAAIEKPTAGKIFYDKTEVTEIKNSQIPSYKRKLGVIYQDYKLLPQMNVFENVALAMIVAGKSDSEIFKQAFKILGMIDLSEKINSFPKELSSGEKQRLAIARAIANEPEIILADEPTGNLDCYFASELIDILEKINQSGITIILATHDRDLVNSLKKRVITLEDGSIIRDDKEGKLIF